MPGTQHVISLGLSRRLADLMVEEKLLTSKKLWDDDNAMTPRGRNPQASLVWLERPNANGQYERTDRVIILNSEGDLILARLDRTGYHEQSRTNIIGPTWSHPAFAGDRVYARNDSELVCVEITVP